jgi:hypothetical protein
MIAAEHDQLVGRERLHADRDPVDPGGAPGGEPVVVAVGRIRLDRDLELVRTRTKPGADRLDRAADAVGPPQRGRAATEIDRDQSRSRVARRTGVELAQDRVEILVVAGRADLDCEIAVRAQLAAPRVVEVDA